MPRRAIALAIAACLFCACRRDPIQTYRVSKQARPPIPAAAHRGTPPLQWTAPPDWKEQPPSPMRTASFLITGSNGEAADLSIVTLAGPAGGDLANINRWRGQINLDPISDKDLSALIEPITPAGRTMHWVEFSNEGKRLMAAIYPRERQTWFFKMMGDDATVKESKPAFLTFLKNLRFHETP